MQAQPSQPGMGTQAGALQKVTMAIQLLQSALPALGVGSRQHNGVLKAIRDLSTHVGEGAAGAGAGQTMLQDLLRNQIRNAMLQRVMQQQGGAGGPGGGGPPPGMSPSTPMPGA